MDLKEHNKRVRREYYINVVISIIAFLIIGYTIAKILW
tara:strand:- start:149 stop:262 length:114 start_codon:yes stop_codon:yes gene_type:complete